MGNTFKTALLLTALTLFLVFVGQAIGGERGAIFAFVIAAVMNFVSYFFSDKIALSMSGAQPVTEQELPRIYSIVHRLTQKAKLPMPKLYVIPIESPNAFATGRNPNHASVAVTEGILNLLNDEELEGVLAHELGHVRNRDILISSIAATMAGAITLLARMGYYAALFGGMGGRDRDREGDGMFSATADDDPGADCRHAHSARHLPLARVRGRRNRSALHRQSLRPGQRLAQARYLVAARPHGCLAQHGSPVHRQAESGHHAGQPVLHPPADRRAHRAPHRHAGGAATAILK